MLPTSIKWLKSFPVTAIQMVYCEDGKTYFACPAKILGNVIFLSENNPIRSLVFCASLAANHWMATLLKDLLKTNYLSICYDKARDFYRTGETKFLHIQQTVHIRRMRITNGRMLIYRPKDLYNLPKLYIALINKTFTAQRADLPFDDINLNLTIWALVMFSDSLVQRIYTCQSVSLMSFEAPSEDIAKIFGIKLEDASNIGYENQIWYHLTLLISLFTKVRGEFGGRRYQPTHLFQQFFKNSSSLLLYEGVKNRIRRMESLPEFFWKFKKCYLDVFKVLLIYFVEFGKVEGSLEEQLMDTCKCALRWNGLQIHRIIARFAQENGNSSVWTLTPIYSQATEFKETLDYLRTQHGKMFPYGMVLRLDEFNTFALERYPDLAYAAVTMYRNTVHKSRKIRNMLTKMGMKLKPKHILRALSLNRV